MKVLLKKEVCGFRKQCTRPTGKAIKKKRQTQMHERGTQSKWSFSHRDLFLISMC